MDQENDKNLQPVGQLGWEKYLAQITARKPKSKAKNYMQETLEPYLPYIHWKNRSLEGDLKLVFMAATQFYKRKTHAEFVRILDWIKAKNTLRPKQVAKVFLKK